MNPGLYSYSAAAVAYSLFALLLIFSWRGSLQARLLLGVSISSALWAGFAADLANRETGQALVYQSLEVFRYVAWYVFLLKLFDVADEKRPGYRRFLNWALPVSVAFAIMVLVTETMVLQGLTTLTITGHVVMALIGLAVIEQLLRNTSPRHRWAIKYLFMGAGAIFVFDFYLYTDALLFRGIDRDLWETRGVWSLNIFVSRDIVLNSTAIFGGGLYLLLMAGAGYYLREYGGSWGRLGQVLFFSIAVIFLAAVLSSGQLRARIKVFLGKHFYKNKYDYRVEWLKLTEGLSQRAQSDGRYKDVIEALAHIVDARAGQLWMSDKQGSYKNVAAWQTKLLDNEEISSGSLVNFFEDKGFIINVDEISLHPEEYEGLELPGWLSEVQRPWLIVPLRGIESVVGFIVLANPLVPRSINWEDRDLLLAVAKQISSHLMVLMTSDALAEAKQFEVFTRLSAYMVHDLKNIASELEMVSRNSKKHLNNPDFIEDAFATVDNAASDIKKLLEQLRNKRSQGEKKSLINLGELVKEAVDSKQGQLPAPQLNISNPACMVVAEKSHLLNVLMHLIDNAQQATEDDGSVEISVMSEGNMNIVEIKDSGHGMDACFIRDRLFKPFDTTKGNAGMGIGMHESREFMQQLGGNIYVQSEVGQGSIIALHIPSSEEDTIENKSA
jgi:putative PEP-CTERM system histidine kinase